MKGSNCVDSLPGFSTLTGQCCIFAGRVVRACFGTTKYCNAFLKGIPCNNGDCLYLHAVGAQRPRIMIYMSFESAGCCMRIWYIYLEGC